jgi:hypothetical protein
MRYENGLILERTEVMHILEHTIEVERFALIALQAERRAYWHTAGGQSEARGAMGGNQGKV